MRFQTKTSEGPKGGFFEALEPWSPEIFVVEPGAEKPLSTWSPNKNAVFG